MHPKGQERVVRVNNPYTMRADIMTLKADMTEVKASIGTLSNHQDVQ